jgi:hypothetical protein
MQMTQNALTQDSSVIAQRAKSTLRMTEQKLSKKFDLNCTLSDIISAKDYLSTSKMLVTPRKIAPLTLNLRSGNNSQLMSQTLTKPHADFLTSIKSESLPKIYTQQLSPILLHNDPGSLTALQVETLVNNLMVT